MTSFGVISVEKQYIWNDATQRYDEFLELSTKGYDMRNPSTVIPMAEKTVIPEPEIHFSFSTMLMVIAIELYLQESERQFCHYVTYAHRKLVQFVESRKQMTAESDRFFVDTPTISFVQHESFHISARSKTKAKDIGASGTLHTSIQNFLVMCGLVVRPSLFMFQKIKLMMFKWMQMMM